MKNLIFAALMFTMFSCSNDKANCEGNANDINNFYNVEIQKVINIAHPIYGPDYRKIKGLNEQRATKLANACN